MAVRIKIDRLLLKRLYDGALNPKFNETAFMFRDDLITEGAVPYSDGTHLYCDMESVDRISGKKTSIEFNMNDFNVVVHEFKGEVFNFWPTVKILTSDMNNSTPVDLIKSLIPEQLIYSESGDEVVETIPSRQKTWHEWANLDGNYNATVVGNYTYFGAHFCAVDGGRALTSNELMLIQNNLDAELVEKMPIIE